MKRVAERLALFRELLESVNPNLVLAELDSFFQVIRTNAPDHGIWGLFFHFSAVQPDETLPNDRFETAPALKAPWVFTNSLGMTWMSEVHLKNEQIDRVIVFGPVFLDDYAPKQVELRLRQKNFSAELIYPFMETLRKMPVISLNRMYEYGIMMHRCLTGETCAISDFSYPDMEPSDVNEDYLQDRLGNYMAETEILRIVEEGNIHYEKDRRTAFSLSGDTGRKIGGDTDYLRQAKNTVIIFITLCSRAAIRGGLSPQVSYHLADQYVNMAEHAETIGKVVEVNQMMYDDYVRRVHRTQHNAHCGISPQIIDACQYISLHVTQRFDIHHLATRAGYTDYYFSAKFKKETGKSVRDYIMEQKVIKAQEMLRDMALEIGDVAMQLGFESQSHMSDVFRKQTGLSPSKWRISQVREKSQK